MWEYIRLTGQGQGGEQFFVCVQCILTDILPSCGNGGNDPFAYAVSINGS